MSESILKLALLQIANTPKEETVKIAGILSKIKNWFKGVVDPAFAASVAELRAKSETTQNIINDLQKSTAKLQDSIDSGNLANYEQYLELTKNLTKNLLTEIKNTDNNINEIKNNFKEKYTITDYEDKGFLDEFQKALPYNFDIKLNEKYDIALKSFDYYKNLDPNQIIISLDNYKNLCKRADDELVKIDKDSVATTPESFANLKQAIVDGHLFQAVAKKPKGTIKELRMGSIELFVQSAPFYTTDSNKKLFQINLILIDDSTAVEGMKRLKIRSIKAVKLLSQVSGSENLSALKKLALDNTQVPNFVTNLTELQLAETLREGYKKAFGEDPTMEVLASGWAQVVLESGRPIKLPNNNIGNIKATDAQIKSGTPYFRTKSTIEFDKSGKSFNHVNPAWVSFNTPSDGAAYYWKFLGRKFNDALNWMKAGDPTSATVELGQKGYFTANIEKYSNATSSLFREFVKTIAPKMTNLKSAPIAINTPKPEIKQWRGDYQEKSETIDDIDKVVDKLMASGTLTSLVKNSILQTKLPKSFFVIKIASNDKIISLEYARKLSFILNKSLNATTNINKIAENFVIETTLLGSSVPCYNTICSISDCLKNEFDRKLGKNNIQIVVAANLNIFEKEKVSVKEINKNSKLFNTFAKVVNGY